MSSAARLLTADDLERMGDAYSRAELWDGVLFVREPATPWHACVETRVASALQAHVEPRALGWVLGSSAGFLVARDPDRVLAPDASFVSFERLPVLPARGFAPGVPDLVVEVRSPETSEGDAYAKGLVWIGHGARVVWLVDPPRRRAVVLRPGRPPVVVEPGRALDADPVLDLRVPLDDLLRGVP